MIPSYHPIQFKGKLINQTGENEKKNQTNFRPNFGLFGQNLGPYIVGKGGHTPSFLGQPLF